MLFKDSKATVKDSAISNISGGSELFKMWTETLHLTVNNAIFVQNK